MNENGLFNELRSILLPGASWTDIFDRLDELQPGKYEKEIEKVQIFSGAIGGPNVHLFSRHPNHDNFPIYKCPKCKKFLKREAITGHMRRKHSTNNGILHSSSSVPSMSSSLPSIPPLKGSSSACASTASSSSLCSASPSTSHQSDPSSSSPTDNSNSSDILEHESLLKLKVRLTKKREPRSRNTSFTESSLDRREEKTVPSMEPPRSPIPSSPPRSSLIQAPSIHPSTPIETRSPRTAKMLGCYLIASTSSSRPKSRSPGPLRSKLSQSVNTTSHDLKEPSHQKKIEKFIRRTRNSSMRSLLDIEEVELIKEPRHRNFNRVDEKREIVMEEKLDEPSLKIIDQPIKRGKFYEKEIEKGNRQPDIPRQCQLEMQRPSMNRCSSTNSLEMGPRMKRRREMSEDEMIDVITTSPPHHLTLMEEDDGDGENRRPISASLPPRGTLPNEIREVSSTHTFLSKAELKEIPMKREKRDIQSLVPSRSIKDLSPPNLEDGNSMDSNHTEPMYSERHSEEPKREGSAPILEGQQMIGVDDKDETESSMGPSDDVDEGPPVLFPQIDAYALEDETVDLADLDGIVLTPFDIPSTSSNPNIRSMPKLQPTHHHHHQTPINQFQTFNHTPSSFQLLHHSPHPSHPSQSTGPPQLLSRPMTAHPQLPSSSTINTPQPPSSLPIIAMAPGGQPRKVYFQQPQIPVQRSSQPAVVLVQPPSTVYSQQQFQVMGRDPEWTSTTVPQNGITPMAQAAVASSIQGPTLYPYNGRSTSNGAPPIPFTADIRVIGADGTEYRYAPQPVRPRMTSYIALQSPHLIQLQPGASNGQSLSHPTHPNQSPQLVQPIQQLIQQNPQSVSIDQSPYLFVRSHHDPFPSYPAETSWESAFEPMPQTLPIDIRSQQIFAVHMPQSRVTEASRIRPE